MGTSRFAVVLVAAIGSAFAADPPPLILSHGWIVVRTGARERTVLEKAGFRIAPTINRHEGQGAVSVTVELLNGFLELHSQPRGLTDGMKPARHRDSFGSLHFLARGC